MSKKYKEYSEEIKLSVLLSPEQSQDDMANRSKENYKEENAQLRKRKGH